MFKHILIPTDGSALALKAAKAGIRLAAQHGARVTVFHAVDAWQPVYTSAYAADARTFVDFEKHAREVGEEVRMPDVRADTTSTRCGSMPNGNP